MSEFINMATGEIVDTTTPRSKAKVPSTRQAIGVDTKYPRDCLTPEHLAEALKNIDAYVEGGIVVDYLYITDSLVAGLFTQKEVALTQYLAQNICGWNYWMGSVEDLTPVVGVSYVSSTITSLTKKGALFVLHKDKPWRGKRVILVNPRIAFRGANMFRNGAVEDWYHPRGFRSQFGKRNVP